MSTTILHHSPKLRQTLIIVGTLLFVTALLVFFLPRETKEGYEYEQGRPWRYNSLIASFDFPIYKTQDEVSAERDSALRSFQPFYSENEEVGGLRIAAFRRDFLAHKFAGVPAGYLPHIERLLLTVYKAGIVAPDQLAKMAGERTPGIRIVEGTEAISRPLTELYSTRSAYEYVMHADTLHYARELLAQCDLNQYLEPNLNVDSIKTLAAREDVIASVSPASGLVQSGQRIIDRGEIVSAEQYKILQSYERETIRRATPGEGSWLIVLGQVLFVAGVLAAFAYYLKLFRRDYLESLHSFWLMISVVSFFPLLCYLMVAHKFSSVYLVPFAMVSIFVRIFMDSRTAFMALVSATLLASIALHSNYEFVVIQLITGLTAIYALRELTERAQLIKVAFYTFLSGSVIMLGYDLTQGIDLSHLDHSMYIYLGVSSVLILFAYPLMYLLERLFGFTSSISLIELSNTNSPILRRMSQVAQGTFVHSLQVSNLAVEVADKIGAKTQLVRTGALYHDIGKMLNPAFFTENQTGVNPHDGLPEEQSARIIINHVTEGLQLAEKYHLPKVIRDFISTHHGHSLVKFFYIQWKNKHPGEEPDVSLFTYPGPNPFTREQAILMMCDAVEATSRSLKSFDEDSIRALVDRIVDGQVQAGYFTECPITFRDISEAKRVLTESLKTIYHTRIAYPEMHPQEEKPAPPRRAYFFGRRS